MAVCTDADVCWICLAGAEGDAPLHRLCACPARLAHPKCLSRWCLQQAGKSEERQCRFCFSLLPDYREALQDGMPTPTTPVMSVHYGSQVFMVRVEPGDAGRRKFEGDVRNLLGLGPEQTFFVNFECQAPGEANSTLDLKGLDAYDAAVFCAGITAARRQQEASQRQQQLLQGPLHADTPEADGTGETSPLPQSRGGATEAPGQPPVSRQAAAAELWRRRQRLVALNEQRQRLQLLQQQRTAFQPDPYLPLPPTSRAPLNRIDRHQPQAAFLAAAGVAQQPAGRLPFEQPQTPLLQEGPGSRDRQDGSGGNTLRSRDSMGPPLQAQRPAQRQRMAGPYGLPPRPPVHEASGGSRTRTGAVSSAGSGGPSAALLDVGVPGNQDPVPTHSPHQLLSPRCHDRASDPGQWLAPSPTQPMDTRLSSRISDPGAPQPAQVADQGAPCSILPAPLPPLLLQRPSRRQQLPAASSGVPPDNRAPLLTQSGRGNGSSSGSDRRISMRSVGSVPVRQAPAPVYLQEVVPAPASSSALQGAQPWHGSRPQAQEQDAGLERLPLRPLQKLKKFVVGIWR